LLSTTEQNEFQLSFHVEKRVLASPPVEKLYSAAQIALIEKLNRADRLHLNRLKALIVPDRWDLDELAYSPLPRWYGAGVDARKCLVVYLPGQVFGAYEDGRLVRWGPVSSGRRQRPTPSGLFHLNWKSAGRHSTVDPQWYMRWYFNIGNREGMALHAYSMPGYPASHACIRLLERDAMWLYGWGEVWHLTPDGVRVTEPGTPVFIVGEYEFGAAPPWRSVAWWSKAVGLPSLPDSRTDAAHVTPASALILHE
jgi:hypothetical protein